MSCLLCELAKTPTDTHTWVRQLEPRDVCRTRLAFWECIVCGVQSWQQKPESFKTCNCALMESALL